MVQQTIPRMQRAAVLPVAMLIAILAMAGCRASPRPAGGPEPAPIAARPARAAPVPPPALDDACATDADCGRGTFALDCCAHCYYVAGSKAWIERMDRHCRGAGSNPGCPVNDCPIQRVDPRCVAGHCQVVPR